MIYTLLLITTVIQLRARSIPLGESQRKMSSSELDSSPLRMPADGASARRKADEPRQNVEGSSSSQGIVQKVKNFGRPLPPPNVPGRKSRALEEIRKYQQSSKAVNTEIAVR